MKKSKFFNVKIEGFRGKGKGKPKGQEDKVEAERDNAQSQAEQTRALVRQTRELDVESPKVNFKPEVPKPITPRQALRERMRMSRGKSVFPLK